MAKIVFTSELIRGKVTVENETTGDTSVYRCSVPSFTPHMIEADDPIKALQEFMLNIGNLQRDPAWKAEQAARNAKASARMSAYHADLQDKLKRRGNANGKPTPTTTAVSGNGQ